MSTRAKIESERVDFAYNEKTGRLFFGNFTYDEFENMCERNDCFGKPRLEEGVNQPDPGCFGYRYQKNDEGTFEWHEIKGNDWVTLDGGRNTVIRHYHPRLVSD